MADTLVEKRIERMRVIENIEALNAQINPLMQQRESLIKHSAKLQQEIAALSAQAAQEKAKEKDPPGQQAGRKRVAKGKS